MKRATVGSEGAVLDHFSRSAFDNYVQPFNELNDYIGQMRPRCNFKDSYEVYNANWTPELFTAFHSHHGYDLRNYIPILIDKTDSKIRRKLLHDYRETVYSLYVEQFCIPWTEWSHKNQMQNRFQAHGAPGILSTFMVCLTFPRRKGSEGRRLTFFSGSLLLREHIFMVRDFVHPKHLPGLMNIFR